MNDASSDGSRLPAYDALPVTEGAPARSSWGLWGDSDVFGTLNLQTPERVMRAAASIRTGRWFALDLDLGLPDPPLGGRHRYRHEVTGQTGQFHDDVIHNWNTSASSQWDGFRHFPHRKHGYYNGVSDEEHGIDHWAARGLAGRCVLVDIDRWRMAQDRPLKPGTADPIAVADLEACIADQGTPIEVGDILLIRTGWTTWYRSLSEEDRTAYASSNITHPGPAGEDLPAWIWNLHISALAADNFGVEMFPPTPGWGFMHNQAIPLLGIPLGELWDLDALGDDCAATGTYDAFFTSAPLGVRGLVNSPPNAIAVR
jgi:hypothetical protein